MQYKLTVAEVDCEAHKALCKTNGIEGFPTLHYFAEGSKTEYSGSRKLERLREFAEKASEGGVKPIQADDLEKDVYEESLVYALLYPSSDRKLVVRYYFHLHAKYNLICPLTQSVLKPLFAPLLGSPTVYTVSDPPSSLTSRLSLPPSSWAIVSFKDHDFATPSAIYTSHENKPAYADGFNSPAWKEFLKKFELHPGEMYFAWRAVSEVHRIGIGAELPYLRGLIV
ncbi:hypothetical protein GYMLUDRAFT_903378 [Collybiopsis luxurians FD-317 M1]|uniref:Thioredoxin domain-containing protein n=1 Tax=Collybiopsis luxurians FD-317 M1 TaxID=944289 RepID=A0A0D0BX66_9AGAR|nr:hypothetical protein GYMLUDRAFT_903378 [Collybiopsis luxurians FD-317 M1]